MAASVASGVFTILSTDTVGTTQDIVIGFNPKWILFFTNGRSEAVDTLGRLTMQRNFGACTSTTNRFATVVRDQDAATAAVRDGGYNETAIVLEINATPAVTGALDINAMTVGGGGFQTIVDDQFAASIRVQFLAVGGADQTGQLIVRNTLPTGVGTTKDITGFGFNPTAVIFVCTKETAAPPLFAADGRNSFGFASGTTARGVWAGHSDDGSANMDTAAYCLSSEIMARLDAAIPTTVDHRADINAFITDGVQIISREGANAHQFFALGLAGAGYAVKNFLTQTDTVTDIVVSGLGFQPRGGVVISANRVQSTADTATAPEMCSVGVFDSITSRRCFSALIESSTATAENDLAIEHDEVYCSLLTTPAIDGLMDVKSVDTDGVTFIMDDADGVANFCLGFFVGDAPPVASSTGPGWYGAGWF